MDLLYRPLNFWPDAYHVYDGDRRIGIVNRHVIRSRGFEREIWKAHNVHFFDVKGEFATRTQAAQAIPRGAIHHSIEAFSRA